MLAEFEYGEKRGTDLVFECGSVLQRFDPILAIPQTLPHVSQRQIENGWSLPSQSTASLEGSR